MSLDVTQDVDYEREKARYLIEPENIHGIFELAVDIRKPIINLEKGKENESPYWNRIRLVLDEIGTRVQTEGIDWYVTEVYNPTIQFLRNNGITDKELGYYKKLGPQLVYREEKLKSRISNRIHQSRQPKEEPEPAILEETETTQENVSDFLARFRQSRDRLRETR